MKISLLFPCKNQAEKLMKNLQEEVLPYFDKLGITYDCIIINDHSNEENDRIFEEKMKEMPLQVRLIKNPREGGKGFAVRAGIEASDADYVLFMDSDLATDLKAMELILPDLGKYDAFMASRDIKGAVVNPKQTFGRRIFHYGSRTLIHWTFHFKQIKDTQCGFKCFRAKLAKEMAKRQITAGFAFDVEYCYFLELNGYKIKEIPVYWRNDADSSIKNATKAGKSFYKDMKKVKKTTKAYLLTPEEKEALC
ncbi:MAG: glycosyltransferase [Bacilli bacterium]|nr:glycosyltransferase [Bacilli bacterium]